MAKSTLPKVKELRDGDYDRLWYPPEPMPCDHPTYLVVRCQYCDHWEREPQNQYHFEILACGPKWPSPKNLRERLRDYEMSVEDFQGYPLEGQLELLVDMGLHACLWQQSGNNWNKLLKQARQEMQPMLFLTGFYLDRPQNAVGDSGWDWMRGDLCTFRNKVQA